MTVQATEFELLTVGEVSRLLRVAGSTVRKWIGEGRVPYIELPGGDYRIPRAELIRTLRGNVDIAAILSSIETKLASAADDEDVRREVHEVRAKRRARPR